MIWLLALTAVLAFTAGWVLSGIYDNSFLSQLRERNRPARESEPEWPPVRGRRDEPL